MLFVSYQVYLLVVPIFNKVSYNLKQVLAQCIRFIRFCCSRCRCFLSDHALQLLEVMTDKKIEHLVARFLNILQALADDTEAPRDYFPEASSELLVIIVYGKSDEFIDVVRYCVNLAALTIGCDVGRKPEELLQEVYF